MLSYSPDRHTFLKKSYIKSCQEENKPIDDKILENYKLDRIMTNEQEKDPKWQKDNLEFDLRTNERILKKVRDSDKYAQNLYAALCNNEFRKLDVIPILTESKWECSWRHAGGIIADMRQTGDYIDWYCSGTGFGLDNGDKNGTKGYVAEGIVTQEILNDLKDLRWILISDDIPAEEII
jgi:hypothetical protein